MQFLIMITRNSILMVLLAISVSCTERQVARTKHEGERSAPAPTQQKNSQEEIENEKLKTLNQSLRSGQGISASELNTLANEILSEQNLIRPEFVSSPITRKKLALLNEAIYDSLTRGDQNEIVDRYVKMVLGGCDENLRSCRYLKFFNQDYLSSKILQKKAAQETNLDEKYRLLMVAFDIKNTVMDAELYGLYASQAAEYEKKNANKPELLSRHRRIMSLIVQSQAQNKGDSQWLQGYQAWQSSKSSPTTVTNNMRHLMSLLAEGHLYENNNLSKSFLEGIKNTQAEAGSFSKNQSLLFGKYSVLAKNLGIQKIQTESEAFFMVDRVYKEAVSATDMVPVFKKVSTQRLSMLDLEVLSKKYIESELALLIQKANESLAEKVSAKTTVTTELMDEATKHSRIIYIMVVDFLRKSKAVHDFLKAAAESRNGSLSKETDGFYMGLRKNIKFSLTYPQMMALSYHLSKLQFEKIYRIFWFTFKITSVSIMQDLFNGVFPPWFDYGHDEVKLDSFELLIAFEMALKTRAFDMFKVQPEDYMNEIFSKLITPMLRSLDLTQQMLQMKYNDGRWRTVLRMCSFLPNTPQVALQFHVDELMVSPLGGLREVMVTSGGAFGNLTDTKELLRVRPGFFLYERLLSRQFEEMRLYHRPFFRRVNNMAEVFRKYLNEQGLSQDEIDKKIRVATQAVDTLKAAEKSFIGEFTKYRNDFDACFQKFIEFDKNLQLKVFHYEREFFKVVHGYMKEIQKNPSLKSQLNKKAQFYAVSNWPIQLSFDGQSLLSGRSDAFLRVKHYMEKGLQLENINLPPLNPSVKIYVPEDASDAEIVRINPLLQVGWRESDVEFAKQALSMFSDSHGGQYFRWFGVDYYNFEGAARDSRFWINTNAIIYLMSPMGDEKDALNVDEKTLISIPEKVVRSLGISNLENDWLNFIGVFDKHRAVSIMEDYLLFAHSQLPMPPYEYLALIFAEEYMGFYDDRQYATYDDNSRRNSIQKPAHIVSLFKELETYHSFRKKNAEDYFVFGSGRLVTDPLDKLYREEVKNHREKITRVIKAIKEKYDQDLQAGQLLQPRYRPNLSYEGPYFNPSWEREIESKFYDFHQRTNWFFQQ